MVRSLHASRADGPSGMQPEHLKMWLRDATRGKNLDRTRWETFGSMATMTLQEGIVPAELTWTTRILLPISKGEYRGIGLV